MSKLGYIDGKNVTIEYRYADDRFDWLPALADELVHIPVDVLMAAATVEALAAKNATRTIPIIFFNVPDPVGSGLVNSLARPGRNITGFTSISAVLAGKRLELLKETIPNLSRVAVLWNTQNSASAEQWKASQQSSRELGFQLHSMEVSSVGQFDRAFDEAIKARSAALVVTQDTVLASNRKRIVDLATKHRLAAGPDARLEAFSQGLRELGYTEGQTIKIEYRWADGKFEKLPELAADLVRNNVDVIVAGVTQASLAAKKATTAIPIVMIGVSDPVGTGLIASLARPGTNVTGTSSMTAEVVGKQLELLKETLPNVSRMAALWNPANPVFQAIQLKETASAARTLGVRLQFVEARGPDEIDRAFRVMTKNGTKALVVLGDPVFISHRKRIADLAAQRRLPAVSGTREHVESGGLMAYGPSFPDMYRRTAYYVDKILKGAKPADLPVEQPTKFELVINLKTAKQIGVNIPPIVLTRADKVIR